MEFNLTHNREVKTSEGARYFWHKHNRRQLKIEKHFIPKISNAIKDQYRSFLNAIEKRGYEYAKANLFLIIKFQPIAEIIKELYLKSAFIESNYVLNYLRRKKKNASGKIEYKLFSFETKKIPPAPILGLGFEELAPVIDQYFEIYLLNKSALPITKTTRDFIRDHLINEVDRGVPLNLAIENFETLALTGGGYKSLPRAVMIARTESTRALSFGGLIGAYMSEVDVDKVWVTSDDERVRGLPNYSARYSHVDLDLNEAPLMEGFYNGERIRFPGDPEASVKNTVRCRCTMFFKEKPEPEDIEERDLDNFLLAFDSGLINGLQATLLAEELEELQNERDN